MKKKVLILFLLLLLAISLCACNGQSVKPGGGHEETVEYERAVVSHSVIGCGGYGAVFNAKINPFDDRSFGATCDMGSVYFTYDAGESWSRHNIQGTVYCLEYDPTTAGVVWIAGSGVYKSTDHGQTMELVFPNKSQLVQEGHNYENANYWLYTGGESDYIPHYQIWSMAINRKSGGNNVYVGQRVQADNSFCKKCIRIYRTDDGENFSHFCDIEYSYNYKLAYDESRDCLICITPSKIYEINQNGEIDCVIEQPVYVQFVDGNKLCFDSYYNSASGKNTFVFSSPSDKAHLATECFKTDDLRDATKYINLTDNLVAVTTDDFGVSTVQSYDKGRPSYEYCEWINDKPVPQQFKWTIGEVSIANDDVVYLFHEAYTNTYDENGTFYINRRTDIYLKYDARKAENERFRWIFGSPLKPYKTTITNRGWQDSDSAYCLGMSSSKANENVLLYCSNVGLYYTADGNTVKQLNSDILGSDTLTLSNGTKSESRQMQRVNSTGVDVICTHEVETDPFDESHLLMACTDIGILQSYDGGASWYRSLYAWQNGTLKDIKYEQYANTCFDLHFDRENRNVVYGLWARYRNVPYTPSLAFLTGPARFGVSYDGGLSWTMTNIVDGGCGLPYKMEVVYNGDKRDIYISMYGYGFFVTHDLGKTFVEMNDGIEKTSISGREAIWSNEILICDLGMFALTGGSAAVPGEEGNHMLYKWNEGESKFEKIGLPSVTHANGKTYTVAAIRDIEYDPRENCLYLACTANNVNSNRELIKIAGGIWKYKDGEFTQVYDDPVSVFSVNLSASGTLYATELSGRVVCFDENLSPSIIIDGLFHNLKRVSFSPSEDVIYVSTWGGAVEKIEFGLKEKTE